MGARVLRLSGREARTEALGAVAGQISGCRSSTPRCDGQGLCGTLDDRPRAGEIDRRFAAGNGDRRGNRRAVVEMIRLPPGLPVSKYGRPSSNTMIGVMELTGRLPAVI